MIKCDLLVVTAPYTETNFPLQAPAIIKASVIKHGYTANTFDINNDFIKLEDKDPQRFQLLKNYFSYGTLDDRNNIDLAEQYVKNIAEVILQKYSPKFIAVSVFTYQCQTFSEMFAETIKSMDPNISIIFGGQGIMTQGINASDGWVKSLRQRKVIDHYIVSEGERAILDLLSTGKGHGINNTDWRQELNLERSPVPDYGDYDLNQYKGGRLMITGSRGCVRRCSFCDIHKHWKTFVFRSGQSIANEMIQQSQKYNKFKFSFTDSLINGSMKAYRDFITVMAKHNSNARNPIKWAGQFIVRGIKTMTKEDWKLTKLAGAESLGLGIESGSEDVRDHMKKQFSNKDLDEFMEQAYLNKIKVEFLMIIGYPTETEKDFQDSIDMFRKYKPYQSIIDTVHLGSTLGVLPGTPLAEDHVHDLSLNDGENFWIYEKNKSLTFKERIKRRLIAGEELQKMGYTISKNDNQIKLLHFLWGIYKNKQKQGVDDLVTGDLQGQKYS
jgi:radical SAM superfamily enzyme YgiQ (UPF0313 family)